MPNQYQIYDIFCALNLYIGETINEQTIYEKC